MSEKKDPRPVISTQRDCTVLIAGKDTPISHIHDVFVELDLDEPDHAAVTLANLAVKYSETVVEGEEIEIQLGLFEQTKKPPTVFKGQVTGIEPMYDSRGPNRVLIRALNQLHKLGRGKQSVTYLNVTDKDIVEKICQKHKLSAKFGDKPPTTKYEHVYQNNMTDLEFLRRRAARIGYEVHVEDRELHFKKREEKDSGLKLQFGVYGEHTLERFMPRLSTVHQVSEVKVFGWDPNKKQEIIGQAKAEKSNLGEKTGSDVAQQSFPDVLHVQSEAPVSSKEEADNIARAILNERLMQFITGDAICRGNATLKPGMTVTIGLDDRRFDGKYYLVAVRHRYVHAGQASGFKTEFKFYRDAKSGGEAAGAGS